MIKIPTQLVIIRLISILTKHRNRGLGLFSSLGIQLFRMLCWICFYGIQYLLHECQEESVFVYTLREARSYQTGVIIYLFLYFFLFLFIPPFPIQIPIYFQFTLNYQINFAYLFFFFLTLSIHGSVFQQTHYL